MKILFVGESWNVIQTNIMGYNHATSSRYEESGKPFLDMLSQNGFEVEYMPGHRAALEFPDTVEKLNQYNVVIFSDIGSDTLLLHPDMQFKCQRVPNRLKIICQYVEQGGGFLMCGGYMSFSGFEGRARYAMTPVADILPVCMLHYDDRVEHPDGITPELCNPLHPILQGIEGEWPDFLGYNKLVMKEGAELIATMENNDVFIAAMNYGKGRTVAFATDCVPHWGTPEFVAWKHYKTLFGNMLRWTAKEL